MSTRPSEFGASWDALVGAIRVRFGAGRLDELGELAKGIGGTSLLVVTDPGVVAAGHVSVAEKSLTAAGMKVTVFDSVEENPTTHQIEAAVPLVREHAVDLIVGLGGGSAMDCAKGVNFVATNGGQIEDYVGHNQLEKPMLPSIGVPTTAGTGSEAQSYALISAVGSHRKLACGAAGARFRAVLLDPDLIETTPRSVAAVTGLDAIAHAVESYVSTNSNPVSCMLAREAWRHLETHLEGYLEAPSAVVPRQEMLLGAHLAGAAIEQSMLGAAHACANPLTARHGLAHGVAVSVMLPHVVRFNREVVAVRYRELAEIAGLDVDDPAEALATRLTSLAAFGDLPTRLAPLGIDEAALDLLATEASEQWTAGFNPRTVGVKELRGLYEAAY